VLQDNRVALVSPCPEKACGQAHLLCSSLWAYRTVVVRRIRIAETGVRFSLSPNKNIPPWAGCFCYPLFCLYLYSRFTIVFENISSLKIPVLKSLFDGLYNSFLLDFFGCNKIFYTAYPPLDYFVAGLGSASLYTLAAPGPVMFV
jgi:hypothetical protein